MDSPRRFANGELAAMSSPSMPLMLVADADVADIGWAFVFAWNTRRWFATRQANDAAGPSAGPIVVVKESAVVFALGSTPSFDEQLARYAVVNGLPPPAPLGW